MVRKHRTNSEAMEDYFRAWPEDIERYLKGIFEDYAEYGDSAVLLTQLRTVARAKGISEMANEIGMTRQGLQKALSSKGNPRLENVNAIMKAMGYHLVPQKLDSLNG
ncbi:MAG: putative addiction module antidote protein [Gammaproteobacteria bacterium]|nr:putative addiction module antidote protein [Gammaproteobacteria bacterium]